MSDTGKILVLAALLAGTAVPARGEDVVIGVAAAVDGASCPAHTFGLRGTALDLVDDWDVPEPPGSPDAHLVAAFVMGDPSVPAPDRWRADIRSPDAYLDGRETWLLVVDCDRIGSVCTLTFAPQLVGTGAYTLEVETVGVGGVIPVDGSLSFTVEQARTFLTVTLGGARVPAEATAWGAAHAAYR